MLIFVYLNKNLSVSGRFANFLSSYRLSHVDFYVYTCIYT